MNLDLDALRSFMAVAELSSFTRAAQRVNRTQSAVSLHIKGLEERLGFRLFERTKRSVLLTAGGDKLLEKAKAIVQVHDDSVRALTEPMVQGRLRLGITEYFDPEHLPQLLVRFTQQYPGLEVEVTTGVTGPLRDLQKAGALDLVIGRRDLGAPGGKVLRRERLCWVAAKSFRLAKRQALPLALLPPGCGVRSQALASLKNAQIPWRAVYCGPSVWGLHAMIASGLAIGCLTQRSVREDLRVMSTSEGVPKLLDSEIVLYGPSIASSSNTSADVQRLHQVVLDYFGAIA